MDVARGNVALRAGRHVDALPAMTDPAHDLDPMRGLRFPIAVLILAVLTDLVVFVVMWIT